MTIPRWKRALRGDREALGQVGRLECGPETMGGQVRHAGTRIAVEATLRRLARGESPARILKGWPILRPGDIEAARRWGARQAARQGRVKAERASVLQWAARSAAPAIAALLTACGPVGEPSTIHPAEVVARQAVEAALRVALAETCRATYPPADAHPVHRIAWAIACAPILPVATDAH